MNGEWEAILDSSMIQAARYTADENRLELEMSGKVYEFTVTPQAAQAFFDAPSKGKFYHAILKDRA